MRMGICEPDELVCKRHWDGVHSVDFGRRRDMDRPLTAFAATKFIIFYEGVLFRARCSSFCLHEFPSHAQKRACIIASEF